MDVGPFGLYSSKRPGKRNRMSLVIVLVVIALVAVAVYAYNRGPGRDRISADVDQYGRDVK